MADGSGTLSPASVWFVAHGESVFDVSEFTIDDQMSSLFEVHVTATCSDGTIDLSKIVGEGAAFRYKHHSGDLIWAGLCAEATQLKNQPQGATTLSVYRFVLVPALWRTTLRRNNRVFEPLTLPKLVEKILQEWMIPFDMKKLKETYRKKAFRVQYGETDFAFLSRVLEEAGISYWFDSDVASGPGSTISSVVFSDQPQTADPLGGPFPYRATGRHKTFQDGENVIFDVAVGQQMRFGKSTTADFDVLGVPHAKVVAETGPDGPDAAKEAVYEDYRYQPGAFLALEDAASGRVADDKGAVRTIPQEATSRTERELGSARHERVHVELSTTALDLAPGHVLAIGQNCRDHHPNPDVSAERKLLVIGRHMKGDLKGIEHSRVTAVPAHLTHRPKRKTPRAKIAGLQSALVVGPVDQEIHADELGRVRVQFHWDREHGYDADSSCWTRVSQGWAGTGFGMIAIPRVGQEVLVAFHDGDPDMPVIVGRLFNKTSKVPYELPKNKTRSGWRSESSGGASRSGEPRGYNELMFEDAIGHEAVSMRAERDLSTLVKAGETSDVGKSRSSRIGYSDAVHAGEMSETFVGQRTGIQLKSAGEITLSTGDTSIVLRGDDVEMEVSEFTSFRAGGLFHISAGPGAAVFLRGGKEVHINPANAGDRTPKPVCLGKADPPNGGPQIGAPYYPVASGAAPPPPKGFTEVEVKNGKEADEAPPAAARRSVESAVAAAPALVAAPQTAAFLGLEKIFGGGFDGSVLPTDVPFAKNVLLRGTEAFQALATQDLKTIATTQAGKALFAKMGQGALPVIIKQSAALVGSTDPAVTAYGADGDVRAVRDPKGELLNFGKVETIMKSGDANMGPKLDAALAERYSVTGPGKGSAAVVSYEPTAWPSARSPGSPSDAVLFHELTHAEHAQSGASQNALSKPDPAFLAQWNTLEEHDTIQSENAYRTERGLETRTTHAFTP